MKDVPERLSQNHGNPLNQLNPVQTIVRETLRNQCDLRETNEGRSRKFKLKSWQSS